MKKYLRVKRNEDFQKIIASSKSKASKCFVIYYAPRVLNHDRIGISVGKKLGNAVERNKVKRQVRMMINEITDFDAGLDLIIIVRARYNTQTFDENKKELSALSSSVYNKYNSELKRRIQNEENN